jgi:hypothetical protein
LTPHSSHLTIQKRAPLCIVEEPRKALNLSGRMWKTRNISYPHWVCKPRPISLWRIVTPATLSLSPSYTKSFTSTEISMRYKTKVSRDLIGVEMLLVPRWWPYNIWVTLIFIHWTSYDLYVCTQVDLTVVYKELCILNTDVLWFCMFRDITDVLSCVPNFGLYLFCNTTEKLSHGIGLSFNYSTKAHSFFHSLTHSLTVVSLFQLVKQSVSQPVRQSGCPPV